MESKREQDANGFWVIRDNPLSKVGVFPYLGKEIVAPHLNLEPNRLYYVYRPAEALEDEATLASFEGVPFIDDHEWLGDKGTPAEQKGVQGVTFGRPYFEYPYLKSDIKIFSKAAQNLINKGKVQLSPGYTSAYKFASGKFEGKDYDLIQYNLRGNHLALVDVGRTGADVAVQDQMPIFTLDSMEFINMEFTPEQIAQLQKMVAEAVAAALAEAQKPATTDEKPDDKKAGATDEKPDDKKATGATDEEVTPAAAEAVVETTAEAKAILEEAVDALAEAEQAAVAVEEAVAAGNTTDSAAALRRHKAAMIRFQKATTGKKPAASRTTDTGAVASMQKQIDALKALVESKTVDAAGIAGQIARRDALASKISTHFGTFDHAAMSLADVAKYGLEKVGIKNVQAGTEVPVMDAWLYGREAEKPATAAPKNLANLSDAWAKQANNQGA